MANPPRNTTGELEQGVRQPTVTELLDAGDEPTIKALRQALTEAAARGLRGGSGRRRKSRRNPYYVPDPLSDDMNRVVGCCTMICEVMERRSPAELLSACIHDEERARVFAHIVAGRNAVSGFEGRCVAATSSDAAASDR